MKDFFLDTSGLFCCLDKGDHSHQEAVKHLKSEQHMLIHNYILAELIALCTNRPNVNRHDAMVYLKDLTN